MTRTELTRRWATVATVAIVIVGIVALLNWEFTSGVITAYETFFKLIGYIVAPSLAYLGFIYGRLDKAELVDLAEQRTKAKLKADAAEKGARRAQNEAEVQRGMAEAAHEAAAVAGDRAEQQAKLAQVATADAEAKTERIAELEDDFSKLSDATQFWKLGNKSRKIRGFAEFDDWKHDPVGARIVTIGLFKGGVGKTHLAGNFAAYVSEKQQKPVLLIDLDFQGSLSSLVMGAGGIDKRDELGKDTSPIDALFDESADSGTVERRRVFLGDIGGEGALNRGKGLAKAWLVPADYSLTRVESALLIDRTVRNTSALDERYRLAHVLLDPAVRRQYAMIIIDTPPRMTLGTINALVASHALIIPMILDKVSGETVRPFLKQFKDLKSDLLLDSLEIAGFVATMTAQKNKLKDTELVDRNKILAAAHLALDRGGLRFTEQHLPRKDPIRSGSDLGYFMKESDGQQYKDLFYDLIFDELWDRIHDMPLQRTNRVKLFNI